jgi:hypothetical protein
VRRNLLPNRGIPILVLWVSPKQGNKQGKKQATNQGPSESRRHLFLFQAFVVYDKHYPSLVNLIKNGITLVLASNTHYWWHD